MTTFAIEWFSFGAGFATAWVSILVGVALAAMFG